jgi:hypothetical protein
MRPNIFQRFACANRLQPASDHFAQQRFLENIKTVAHIFRECS